MTETTGDAVTLTRDGGTATITLNRPEAKNRLDGEGMTLLLQHLRTTADDDAVRVVVVTGTGNVFCSGADLAGAVSSTEGGFAAGGTQALVDVLTAMIDHPKPLIARVQGHVAGGGNGLVAACDIAVAQASAKFAFSEVRLGLAPAIIATVCIPRMHPRDAAELLLTGERVGADRVQRAGLVTKVVEDDALDGAVEGYINSLLACGPNALIATKQLLRQIPGMPMPEAFEWTAQMSARLFTSDEAKAGMTAFLTKQPAPWVPTQ